MQAYWISLEEAQMREFPTCLLLEDSMHEDYSKLYALCLKSLQILLVFITPFLTLLCPHFFCFLFFILFLEIHFQSLLASIEFYYNSFRLHIFLFFLYLFDLTILLEHTKYSFLPVLYQLIHYCFLLSC